MCKPIVSTRKPIAIARRFASFSYLNFFALYPPFILAAVASAILVEVARRVTVASGLVHASLQLVGSNPMLQLALSTSALGLASAMLYQLYRQARARVLAWLLSSVTLRNSDPAYDIVLAFLSKHVLNAEGGSLTAQTKKGEEGRPWWMSNSFREKTPEIEYKPSENGAVKTFRYAGARIMMTRWVGQTLTVGWERKPTPQESLTLTTWGTKNAPLTKLIEDAMKAHHVKQNEDLCIYELVSSGWCSEWVKVLSKKARSVESVILDEALAEKLLKDAREFIGAANWYSTAGIPYRRGYLLHGPPGNGKTSFCQALAGELGMSICLLNLANGDLTDSKLADSLRDAPKNAIVLLEDVDAVFVDNTNEGISAKSRSSKARVTFSGLLNALDGVAAQEGRIFMATTNHIERLDPALIRPGRCDVRAELKNASCSQAARLFRRFFPNEASSRADAFAEGLPQGDISMARLQGHLLEHKSDPAGAIETVPRLLRGPGTTRPMADRTPIYDHLRRVGLEDYAPTFRAHGYYSVADLRGLDAKRVKEWSGTLRLDRRAADRMGMLLSGDSDLLAEYQIATVAFAKEMFLATYATTANARDDCETDSEYRRLAALAERFVSAVTASDERRSRASIWQLRRHLQLFNDNPEAAVAAAPHLVSPEPRLVRAVDDMKAYDWLRRIGLEDCTHQLEKEGFQTAADIYSRKLPASLRGVSEHDLKVISDVAKGNGSAPAAERGYVSADRARLCEDFYLRFASHSTPDDEEANAELVRLTREFAMLLTNPLGDGIISINQLNNHLESFSMGAGAVEARRCVSEAHKSFLHHTRPKPVTPPPSPPPTEWIYGWLAEHSLEEHVDKFIKARITEKSDLTMDPRLGEREFQDIGIEPLGDRRGLAALTAVLA